MQGVIGRCSMHKVYLETLNTYVNAFDTEKVNLFYFLEPFLSLNNLVSLYPNFGGIECMKSVPFKSLQLIQRNLVWI